MCGIFGVVASTPLPSQSVKKLLSHAQQRGRDSSGLVVFRGDHYEVARADCPVSTLARGAHLENMPIFLGHSRLVTNGTADNQPVIRDGICVLHNGIIVNEQRVWEEIGGEPLLHIDTEVVNAIVSQHLDSGGSIDSVGERVLALVQGVVACAVLVPNLGKLVLFSNNGSLYAAELNDGLVFASDAFALREITTAPAIQIRDSLVIDVPSTTKSIQLRERRTRAVDLVPGLGLSRREERLLDYPEPSLRRCTTCVLPETMPFIEFDEDGVCNYCHHYVKRNSPKPKDELFKLVEPYRRQGTGDAIVPFSGGRDSCYALHLAVNELGMKPITYTYDWGMVTDLGRRNISRMSAALGVENIIVAADISKKRRNIRRNLQAWLKAPNLGMLSVLTAGDKHFFKYVERVKDQTGIQLNLWGINPLEVTHFKAGFLGVPPDFAEDRVYSHGWSKQLRYQQLRFAAMAKSPGYFNPSLWDTLSGEYHRSLASRTDYFHIFDYWRWDEKVIDQTLADAYDWERAPDTQTTWRIGDGTAAFYNYANYTIAGFTEHDTFRSNQVREGDLSREDALALVKSENIPRYPNLKWYLDVLGMDFESVIRTVNRAPRMYE